MQMKGRVALWRLTFLIPALLLFMFGGYKVLQHLAVLKQAEVAGALPQTAYGEHSGMAVASFALGLAYIVVTFFRRR